MSRLLYEERVDAIFCQVEKHFGGCQEDGEALTSPLLRAVACQAVPAQRPGSQSTISRAAAAVRRDAGPSACRLTSTVAIS
jgi:hypothetical protein